MPSFNRVLAFRLAATAVVLVSLGIGYGLTEGSPQVQPARVLRANGTAEIRSAGTAAYRRINERERVRPGDSLRTGTPGEIILELSNRNLVRIGPASEITLSRSLVQRGIDPENRVFGVLPARRDRQDVELDLSRGTATNLLRGLGPNAQFNLRTPVAVAGVRGTIFVAEVTGGDDVSGRGGAPDPPAVNFICVEGSVNVTPVAAGGFSPIDLLAGQMMSVQMSAPPPTGEAPVPGATPGPTPAPVAVTPPAAAPPEVLTTFTTQVTQVEAVQTQDASTVESPQTNDQNVIQESQDQSSSSSSY